MSVPQHPPRRAIAAVVVLTAFALNAAGCGPVPAKDVGAALFADPRLAGDGTVNAFSCATCHAMGAAGDAVYAGADLQSAARRVRFWGGYSTSLLDATNVCLTVFMRGNPLTADDPRGRALYEYLAAEAAGAKDTADKPLDVVENISALPGGAASGGSKVWDSACRACHGDPHTGAGRITETTSIVPEASIQFARELPVPTTPDLVVIEKVRHGAFFGVGGTMPPFSKQAMSDEDLGALLSFLGL